LHRALRTSTQGKKDETETIKSAENVGVAHELAMTSQLKRIRKCMLTTADRTCAGAQGYLD